MKFLLVAVNAKYIHSNPAIYSLRAYAGKELRGYIELAEYTINQQTADILADIYCRKPDVIGISCYIWNWTLVKELLTELPKVLPDAGIWLGGPEVSYDAEKVLRQFPSLAGIMVGEGEQTFRELLQRYVEWKEHAESDFSAEDITGLCLPAGRTGEREPLDINEIPFLYEDLTEFENRIIYYESSRGCPFRCSYCLSSIDKRVRFRDPETVSRELQFFLDHRVKQVKFIDRTFNCDHAHAMAIWQYLYEHDNGVTNFHFEISADLLREEELALLSRMRPGLVQLEIGVQSANPKAIREVCRVTDLEKLERNVARIRQAGNIHQHLDLIAGLPFEDYESFGRSFDRVYAMRPEQLQPGFLKVLKGSVMEEKAEEYGIRYTDQPPYEVLFTKWLSFEEVRRLKKVEEMVELYYNSNQFTHVLPFLEQAFEGPFAMFERLAEFYEQKGYFVQSPARAYRYQVLLDFAESCDGAYAEIYRELFTFDLYLRENLKSRPDFCGNVTETVKERVRAFYQTEERERRYLPCYGEYDWKQMSRMTHMEWFRYPVWNREKLAECRKSQGVSRRAEDYGETHPFAVLFDYQKRDPLNHEAAVIIVSEQEQR